MSTAVRGEAKSLEGCVAIVGKESAGKSQLITSLTGRHAYVSNFRGSTVHCEVYRAAVWTFVDMPGISRRSDTITTHMALSQLAKDDRVLLVVQATHIDEDLADLLPLVKGKQGSVVVTFWDKVQAKEAALHSIERLSQNSGLSFIPVDARHLNGEERSRILAAVDAAPPIQMEKMRARAGWRIEPSRTLLEHPSIGPLLAILLLLSPAITAVWMANSFASLVEPKVQSLLLPIVGLKDSIYSPLKEILFGNYGFVTMGPLLFVWAVPTVVLFALILGSYKASGLIDRITVAIHPLMRPFGLSGRDLVRVIMGFGCNVPAVVSTRACSRCSRGTCISAIAFGSACSYQLGATLSVFAAAHRPFLILPYLLFLTVTALVYVRVTAPREARSKLNVLLIERRTFLQLPRPRDIWRESRKSIVQFFSTALSVFFLITMIASVLDWLNAINRLASVISPLMALFRLPASAALPVLLSSIRKDGILLFARQDSISTLTSAQILTGVYLAGVLFPCLVTALTISREVSTRFALKLMGKQALFAVIFSMVLAWVSAAIMVLL